MIEIECDNCERTFEVGVADAGGKVACPYCGDVNRVPAEPAPEPRPPESPQPPEPPQPGGRPPEAGPEQPIRVIHPAMFRAHPFRAVLVAGLLVGGLVLAGAALSSDRVWSWLRWVGLLMCVIAVLWWVFWYVSARLWVKLTVSSKRTIRHEGIIRRHTSEVLHDHVRNVEIRQSFCQRLFNVGYLGISSSGQDGIEIEVRDIPKPYELKALIDKYRKM